VNNGILGLLAGLLAKGQGCGVFQAKPEYDGRSKPNVTAIRKNWAKSWLIVQLSASHPGINPGEAIAWRLCDIYIIKRIQSMI